ncbi:MAG: pyrroline-5-carboxylate reductase [Gammaproteobacteria bacterium]|nr:pyrroline-5-carboxylate reductase [Gammaproteobacteria bacterium]
MNTPIITIIGCGNMGASLIGGLIKNGHPADKLWVTDSSPSKLEQIAEQWGVQTSPDNVSAIQNATIVMFAVKPQILHSIATELATDIQEKKPLVISIAAGIRESSLSQWLGKEIAIIRSMPNTPALIGCGATALYANKHVSDEQRENAQRILGAVGLVVWVDDEKLMDTITALSGSGPAYFFLIMDMLQNAAQELGLPSDIARVLTLQTALGAARMALESQTPLSELRKQVTSPGGTTEKAIEVLQQSDIQSILHAALTAAKNRSEELALQLAESS